MVTVFPLDKGKIAILGGYEGLTLYGDVLLFDTKTNEVEQAVADSVFRFTGRMNFSALMSENNGFAFVKNREMEPLLIYYH